MKQLFYILQLFFLLTCSAFAQQPFNFVSSPGPSAQNGNLSSNVNSFTGKLGLSIPFYQYKSPSSNLAFSVSLDYSSGGLKLTENPTCVGAGWNLNAGGSIHRIINGLPDDIKRTSPGGNLDRSGFSYAPVVDNVPCPLNYRTPGYYDNPDNKTQQDSEADEFQFNFLGKQGSFVIPKNGLSVSGPQPLTKPQSNLKFSFVLGNSAANITTRITQIIITDDNGIEYSFTGLETTKRKKSRTIYDSSTTFQSGIGSRRIYHYEYDFIDEYYIIGWNLTKIKDTNSGEEMNLEYEDYSDNTKSQGTVTEYTKNGQTLGDWYWDNKNFEQGTRQRLKLVRFNNNDILRFVYDKIYRCDYLSDKALININIENANGNILTYGLNFVYYKKASEIPYTNCSSFSEDESRAKWLFLNSITKNIPTVSTKIAEFEYIKSSDKVAASSPDNILPTRKEAKNQDAWGFYNGDEVTVNRYYNTPLNIRKSPYQYSTEIGSLKKVIYPSGGITTFEYEGNAILGSDGTDVSSYGIRVKKITQYDGINTAKNVVKEYRYLNESGKSSGFAMNLPPSTYTNKMKVYSSGATDSYVITSSTTVLPPIGIQGSPTAYSRVEEISSLGKTINEYRSFSDQLPLVTTYTYPFANKDRIADWNYGLLMKQTIKDINGNTVKYTQNNFNVVNNTASGAAFRQIKTAYQTESDAPVFTQSNDATSCSQATTTFQFVYDPYNPITGRAELRETNEKNYLKDGSIFSNKVQYEYDPNQYSLKKVTSYTSTNDKLEKIMFYPYEYSTSSSTYKLVGKNITSLPVSSLSILTKTDGSKFITGYEKTEFQGDNSVRPFRTLTMKSNKPILIPSAKTTFTPEEDYGEATTKLTPDVTYNKFDVEGKALQTTSKETYSSAIWDLENKVIVAKANALTDDIAYTSFETNERGNWNYSGTSFFEFTAPAGKKCFSLGGNTITKSLLTPAITYIISYWSNGGSCNVGGTSPYVTGKTINGWTYYKHKISGIQSLNIAGSVLIDELRIHPENARMTTVTYEPLTGVTSESGTEGEITKYEYDSFGRLLDIKNQFGNILKVFCYNSSGVPSACGDAPVFKNIAVPKTLYKNCGPGYSTNAINYTVPAGRYISFISQEDANAQADKDVLTFGQSSADKTGVCTQTTIYARLSYENVTYSGSSTYGDVVVKFFSNASCTQPINVSNVPISYYYNNAQNSSGPAGTGNVTANGPVTILQRNALLQWQVYECDAGTGPCFTNTYSNDYYLNQSPNYQIAY